MTTAAEKNSVRNNQVINDFGQKIGGAHKDRAREAAERLAGVDASALMLQPLSKVAKLTDLRGLYLAGVISSDVARLAWYYWAQIGTKPSGSWPTRLQRWADRAAALIGEVSRVLSYGLAEKSQISDFLAVEKPAQKWDLFNEEMTAANWPADEYKRGAYFVGHYWMNPARFSIHTEKGSYSTAFDSVAECVKAILAKVEKNTTKEPQKFSMYQTSAGKYFISPKGKSGIKLLEFDNSADAWAAYGDAEKLGKIYEELKKFPSERRDWNRPRLGEDWRGGQDMTPEAFGEVFPFRGVEFGNWVNQLERAACLNECADALNDLAGVIGIRPEAVALGGSLAWAFGSRGVGKALAHYEPARRVVNLTKKKGNGCVAHEWFHALDNYMMIKAGKPSLMAVSDTHAYGDAEKSPIFEAAKALKNALLKSDMYTRSRRIDAFRSAPYWATVTEMAARGFEAVVFYALQDAGLCNDYLVSIKEATDYTRSECYPYPTREEAAELAPLYRDFIEAAFTEAEREVIKPAAELPAPPALVTYDPAQPIESAPFQVQDEAPAVAASEPMDANNDPTPADGVQGAAYGDPQKSQIFMNPGEVYKTVKADRYIIILSDDGEKLRTTDAIRGRFSGNIDTSDKDRFISCLDAGSIIKADASQLPPVTDVHTWREGLENGYGKAFEIRTELIYTAADAMTEAEKADTAARMGFRLPLDPLAVLQVAALHKWNASRGNYRHCAALEWLVTQQDEPTAFQMNAGAYPVIFADYARRI